MFKCLEMLHASEVIAGNMTIDQVPKRLRDNVKKIVDQVVSE